MDLLIVLTYVALAWAVFKIFRIPVNQWTLATAALGGVFLVSGLILLMNYNHPYTFTAQKAVIAIPITPQVTGIVTEVTDKNNQLIQKGEVHSVNVLRQQVKVIVTVERDEKEIREYKVDQLKFKPRKKKGKGGGEKHGGDTPDAELKQLEALEKKEGKSKLDDN